MSGNENWAPIGNDKTPFTGTFDGNGHTISNLTIGTESSPNTSSYLGLFGNISSATIKNVGIKNASIYSTGNNVGALVGYSSGTSTITNTYATGSVSGCSYVGGLIGYIYDRSNAVILNSYATDKVTGSNNYIGGLIGQNGYNYNNSYSYGAKAINCYATGSVAGSSNIGGLVGLNNGTITNSYATGSATGASYVGGLVGYNYNDLSKIINSYAVGNVSGNQTVGCLVGYSYSTTVTDGYWRAATQMPGCGNGTLLSATGMGASDMQAQAFADTLNANIDSLNLSNCICWKYNSDANKGFPVLQGIGDGVGTSDTTTPVIDAYEYQNYTDGTETIHATVTDDSSGIAIQKYAAGAQESSYFASNGTVFSNSAINGLKIGTYTIYAKDNAGNETVKVTTYTAMSGTGTATDPYVITTPLQLSVITTGLNKCYKLGNNIDLSGYANWAPIGNDKTPFTGTFDGNGHTISNLTIGTESSPNTSSYLGLFGYISSATIKNVGIKNASISSTGNNVGALVGYSSGTSTITNTYATGSVSGCSYVGGLIGYIYDNSNAVISNSYATDKVTGSSNYIGGLIGQNGYINNYNNSYSYGAKAINCYATGSVAGSSNIGGLVGLNNGTITNSYATGSATGASYVGGLVGYNNNGNSIIINSYAVGNVSGNQTVGCLVGYSYSTTVTDGYWKMTAQTPGCGNGVISTATGMATADMQTQAFANTLNTNIDSLNLSNCICWKCNSDANNGFPVLQGIGDGVGVSDTTAPTITADPSQNYTSGTETIHATVLDDNSGIAIKKYASGTQEASYFASNGIVFNSSIISGLIIGTYTIYAKDNAGNEVVKVVTFTSVLGSGTSADPYIITTAAQLAGVPTGLSSSYKLGNDIDLSGYVNWTPIGSDKTSFTGNFDGNGYTISNLKVGTKSYPSTASYVGLFGYTGATTIKNVRIKNAAIYSTGNYVGALVGYCNGTGTVKNAYITGNVSGGSYVGGLAGYISNTTVSNSYTTGNVSGGSYVGGLIGFTYNSNVTISNSYAIDKVTGSSNYVGGLVGQNSGIVMNCYENSIVTGSSDVGGIAGYNSGKILNSYAAGSASGSQIVGCLVGYNYSGTVTSGYWKTTAQMAGYGSNAGTFTATEMSASDMQTQIFADTLNANINSLSLTFCVGWKYYSGVNNGFPVLQGVGDGDISSDTKAPTIEALAFQNYSNGTETIQTTITDDSSGIAIQKYAPEAQTASYFASNGTAFTSSPISGLATGTYTIYAKDNAGNEAIKVVTFTPILGSGTSSDPYIITTSEQLAGVSTGLGKYYKLGNNIDLTSYSNWTPIGSNTAPFTGNFEGSGYLISNLTIGTSDKPSALSYQGLFGSINGATIKNLFITVSIYSSGFDIGGIAGYVSGASTITNTYVSGTISGGSYTGGLIGNVLSSTATISNSFATDKVTGSSDYIGGLIGQNRGIVTNCYSRRDVLGSNNAGGLVGQNGGTITNCYAKGDVTGSSNVGGLIGQSSGTITNCYATGNISGTSNIGGFVGTNSGKVINAYAAGSVSGSSSIGGFAGKNTNTVTDGYWNTTAISSGYGTSTGTFSATGMALADMQTLGFAYTLSTNIDDLNLSGCVDWKYVKDTPVLQGIGDGVATTDTTPPTIDAYEYQNYSTNTEEIRVTIYDDNSGIAVQKVLAGEQTVSAFAVGGTLFTGTTIKDLTVGTYTIYAKDNAGNEAVKVVTYSSAAGDGTGSNPYIIKTAGQLAAIPTGLGKCYKLGNNIDLSSYRNWAPIGTNTEPFTGTFDGNGYTISNLKIGSLPVPSSSSYVGLFGAINQATVKNVTVNASIYSSGNYIGGLVGASSNSSTIADAYLFGTVAGNNYVGGLVGYNSSSAISSSSSQCTVSSSGNNVGGLVGSNVSAGTIINSYSSGNVSGTATIGGFVGSNAGTVTNSYEMGNASGNSSIGGFSGSNSGSIINSYEAGGVTGTSNVGGFTGSGSGKSTDCYYNSTANSTAGSSDATGMSLSAMKKQSFADRLTSNIDDLNNTNCMEWSYDPDYNNGLPSLDGVPVYETNSDGTKTTKVTNPDGSTSTKTYDRNGNLISDKNSKNGTTFYTYDDSGVLQTKTDPNGTVTTYNSDGTIDNITDSKGNSISYTYDSNGNLISKYDSELGETTYTYYSNGVMKSETDPDGTVYSFNSVGSIASITYSDGRSITYAYNSGNLTEINDSKNGITSFTYDSNGNLVSETDSDGTIISCNSDGKPASIQYKDGTKITYEYDNNGNLVSYSNTAYGTTTLAYDSNKNLISVSSSDGTVIKFDPSNKTGKLTYPNGRVININYNTLGNISSTKDSVLGDSSYTYDGNNQLVSISQPNGQTFSLNSSGRITSIRNQPNTSSVSSMSYSYDENGNILSISEDNVQKAAYQYDSNNQLIREDNGWLNKSITYTYDGNGNTLTKTEYAYTTGTLETPVHVNDYQYGASNQLTNYDGNELNYDSKGNLTSYNGSTYSWDGNNLSGIANADSQIAYQYNDKGIRKSKTVNGKTTTYTLDNKYNVAGQTDGTDTMTFLYDMYNNLAAMTYNGTTYTYEKDVQGDIIGLFDSSNNEVVRYSYDSWGKLISIDGSLADTLGKVNPFRYRGYYYDTESQLYYLQSRYYNPEIDRFISKDDPKYIIGSDAISANLYAYCLNNPVNLDDPSGHWAENYAGFGWVYDKIVKEKVIGFNVNTCPQFLSKAFCNFYAWDIIRQSGWHWSVGKGFNFVGLSITELEAEFYTHAVAYYFTSATLKLFNKLQDWNDSAVVIDVAANDPREWRFLLVWNCSRMYPEFPFPQSILTHYLGI